MYDPLFSENSRRTRKLVVVGFLVDAEVFNGNLDILNGSISGVDRDCVDVIVGSDIFFRGNPRTALINCQGDVEACVGFEVTDNELRIHNFETRESGRNVTGLEYIFSRNVDGDLFEVKLKRKGEKGT